MPAKLKLKFSQQVLLIISLPVLFQIIFVSVLTANLLELKSCYERERDVSDVMIEVNNFLSQIMTCAGSQAIYQITKDPKDRTNFENGMRIVEGEQVNLKNLLKKEASVSEEVNTLDVLFRQLSASFERGVQALNTQDQVDAAVAYMQARRSISKVNTLAGSLREKLGRARQQVNERQERVGQTTFLIVSIGFAINLVLAILLLIFFDRSTSKRFGLLTENIQSLGMERPLKEKLSGFDEIAELDTVLHQVSSSLKEARVKEKAIIKNAADMICALDSSLRIILSNPAAEQIFALSADELMGRSLISLLAAGQDKRVSSAFSQIAKDQAGSFEAKVVDKNKREIELSWNVIWSAEMKSYFCVAHDITERKRLETLRKEFVAMLSHDLRAPLTSLQLTLNVLAKNPDEMSPKAVQRVGRAEGSINVLVQMINELLEMEKLESELFQLEKNKCEGAKLIKESLALVEETARAARVNVDVDAMPVSIVCDGERIIRVITNLVGNALKYSPENSTLNIRLSQVGALALFEVNDAGPGIPADKLQLVFERFRQLSDGQEKKGTGLGLAICKVIVDAHGGDIGVNSKVGEGSTFWFKLPLV